MSNIVARSAGWGAIFGAIAAFASGLCLAIFWSTERTGHTGDFAMLMALWVPPVAIVGGGAAAVLFGVVAVIVSSVRDGSKHRPSAIPSWVVFCR